MNTRDLPSLPARGRSWLDLRPLRPIEPAPPIPVDPILTANLAAIRAANQTPKE